MNPLQRYIIAGAGIFIVLFLMWYFGDIVQYILISAVLSFLGRPLVDLLCRIKIKHFSFPKWLAATITLILLWSITIILSSIFLPIIIDKIYALSHNNIQEISDILSHQISVLEGFITSKTGIRIEEQFSTLDIIHNYMSGLLSGFIERIDSVLSKLVNFVIASFSISFITFFFLKESALFSEGLIILFPDRYEQNIRRALQSSINLLSRYFIGLFLESSIKLIVIALGLYFMGLSLSDSLIIALISAILNVIPYIGPILGGIIGIVIGIASGVPSEMIYSLIVKMTILFTAFQIIDNVIIQPYIYSSSVKAHPLEIFIVILVAGSIAGVVGMLLAIPSYTILRVFSKEFFNKLRLVQKLTEKI